MDDVHYGAELPFDHVATDAAQHVPGAVEIQVDHCPPAAVGNVKRTSRELPSSVVHQEVNGAEAFERACDELFHLRDFPNVGGHYEALGTAGSNVTRRLFQRLGRPRCKNEVGTEAGKGEGNGTADAFAPSSH